MVGRRSSVWLQFGKDGQMELVISRELWNTMRDKAVQEEDYVRVSLADLDKEIDFKSITFIAGSDQPPCEPVSN